MTTLTQIQTTISELLAQIMDAEQDTLDSIQAIQHSVEDGRQYRFIAASQTNAALETSVGAIGDRIEHLLVIPTSSTPGTVSLKDGGGTAFQIYAGTGQQPVSMPLKLASSNGVWQVTTGANVTVLVTGEFS